MYTFELQLNGDCALDIRFADAPSPALSEAIIALAQAIESASIPGVMELVPAYQCLTVCFNPLQLAASNSSSMEGIEQLQVTLTMLVREQLLPPVTVTGTRHRIKIPVCYETEFAPDMSAVSAHSGLSVRQIIDRHTASEYLVHMLGFTPGFLYLGGLDKQLHCPRKQRPALRVTAGSVGIGGTQTGIYPQATPGGWQVIGRTPLALFRPQQHPAFIARPLDRIQFVAIGAQEFSELDPLSDPEREPIDNTENEAGHGRDSG